MAEIKQSQAIIENALMRLAKEKKMYEDELLSLQQKLAALNHAKDRLEVNLIVDQMAESKKAMEMVERQMEKYSYTLGEK